MLNFMNEASEKFKKLSLEKKAKVLLKNYYEGKDSYYNCSPGILLKAWDYLKDNGYVVLAGGTSKSGPGYRVTGEGLNFISSFEFPY